MAFWDNWIAQAKGLYAGMGTRERVIVVGGTLLMLAGLVTFAFVMPGNGGMAPLSSVPFDASEQARAIEVLAAAGIRPTVEDGILMVPRESVGPARLLLAGQEALPRKGFGFPDLVNRQPFSGRHEQDRNWLIALQGELEKSIQSIDGVESARVILNPGDENLSILNVEREFGKPTASVLLRLRRRDRLPEETVAGIRNLVSASWKGLMPEDVKITDTLGRSYEPRKGRDLEQASTLLGLQGQIEAYYAAKVRNLFTGLPGVVAVVNARLKASAVERQINRVNPDEVVDLLRKTVEERKEHVGEKGGPPVGVDSNIGTEVAAAAGTQKLVDTRLEEEVQSDVTRIVEKIIEKPGEVAEITASVMIPRRLGDPSGDEPAKPVPFAEEELAKFKEQVMGACGITDPRLVRVMDFDPPADFYPVAEAWWREVLREAARRPEGLLLGIASLAAIFFLARFARPGVSRQELEAAKQEAAKAAAAEAAPELKMPELSPEEKIEEQVRSAVSKNPQLAAGLIRRWLMEDAERGGR